MVGEEDESLIVTLQGFVSKEIKELVVIGVEVDDDDVALKDCCSHRDASTSGVGLLRKMSMSGSHDSMFLVTWRLRNYFFKSWKKTREVGDG